MFGWRHFNGEVDPDGVGRPDACGVDAIDFLDGQTGNRSYEEGQRAPGDFEAITSQGRIANHGRENPGASDAGVYMYRKLLRAAATGKNEPTPPPPCTRHCYAQDTVVRWANDRCSEKDMVELGRSVLAIAQAAEELPVDGRDGYVRRKLDELDGGWTRASGGLPEQTPSPTANVASLGVMPDGGAGSADI